MCLKNQKTKPASLRFACLAWHTKGTTVLRRSGSRRPRRVSSAKARHPPCQPRTETSFGHQTKQQAIKKPRNSKAKQPSTQETKEVRNQGTKKPSNQASKQRSKPPTHRANRPTNQATKRPKNRPNNQRNQATDQTSQTNKNPIHVKSKFGFEQPTPCIDV